MSNLVINPSRKSCLSLAAGVILTLFFNQVNGQQHIINKKDVTRPETSSQYNSFNLSAFTAAQQGSMNSFQWPEFPKHPDKRVIIEYSFDGLNFLSGPEVLSPEAIVTYQNFLQDTKPILYRLRTEEGPGTISYSGAFLPKGMKLSPVQIQNNVITGHVVNLVAQFPVEKVIVTSGDGIQQFGRDINGLRDFISLTIPPLKPGIYFMTFYGNGWNSTSSLVIE